MVYFPVLTGLHPLVHLESLISYNIEPPCTHNLSNKKQNIKTFKYQAVLGNDSSRFLSYAYRTKKNLLSLQFLLCKECSKCKVYHYIQHEQLCLILIKLVIYVVTNLRSHETKTNFIFKQQISHLNNTLSKLFFYVQIETPNMILRTE